MDKEKRAADWPIKPGVVVGHSSDGENAFDLGVEVGLTPETSLYIGEVSAETLSDYGVTVPFQGHWLCYRTATELRPIALMARGDGWDGHVDMARIIGQAICVARLLGNTEAKVEIATGGGGDTITDGDTPARLMVDLCAGLRDSTLSKGRMAVMTARAQVMVDRGL